ncbi:MAG: hypothetical protein AAB838_03995 [Patescibacteria group bacterium]
MKFLAIIPIIALALAGYFFFQNQQLQKPKIKTVVPIPIEGKVTECKIDKDCGINICDCKAEPQKNLTPNKLMCTIICNGIAKCIDDKCVLVR